MALGGVLAIAFGVLLVLFPGTGLVSLVWLVGIWAIAYGITNLGLAHRLHGLNTDLNKLHEDLNTLASAL